MSSLTDNLHQLSQRAQSELRATLRTIDYSRPVDEWRDTVIGIMDACCSGASQVSATESAIFYDGLRERVVGSKAGTYVHDGRKSVGTEKSVKAFIGKLLEGDYEAFEDMCCERIDYEINAASGRCMEYNARHDPDQPRFARVPQGETTCDFCIMLASRGPVYYTEESAGAFTKFHLHCDCKIVPFWDTYVVRGADGHYMGRRGRTSYEGYDPDAYYERYLDLMLNPKFADRMARAADNAKAKNSSTYGLGRGDKYAWGVANAKGLTEFPDIHAVTQYIRNATSYEDLCERVKNIGKEIEYYGLSDKQYKHLIDLCKSVRAREISK